MAKWRQGCGMTVGLPGCGADSGLPFSSLTLNFFHNAFSSFLLTTLLKQHFNALSVSISPQAAMLRCPSFMRYTHL